MVMHTCKMNTCMHGIVQCVLSTEGLREIAAYGRGYMRQGEGIALPNVIGAVEQTLEAEGMDPSRAFMFDDMFMCMRHHNEGRHLKACPDKIDIGKFEEVIQNNDRLLLQSCPFVLNAHYFMPSDRLTHPSHSHPASRDDS